MNGKNGGKEGKLEDLGRGKSRTKMNAAIFFKLILEITFHQSFRIVLQTSSLVQSTLKDKDDVPQGGNAKEERQL